VLFRESIRQDVHDKTHSHFSQLTCVGAINNKNDDDDDDDNNNNNNNNNNKNNNNNNNEVLT